MARSWLTWKTRSFGGATDHARMAKPPGHHRHRRLSAATAQGEGRHPKRPVPVVAEEKERSVLPAPIIGHGGRRPRAVGPGIAVAPPSFMAHFTVFVLACFVGYMVIWNVTAALHTPAYERNQRDIEHHYYRRVDTNQFR